MIVSKSAGDNLRQSESPLSRCKQMNTIQQFNQARNNISVNERSNHESCSALSIINPKLYAVAPLPLNTLHIFQSNIHQSTHNSHDALKEHKQLRNRKTNKQRHTDSMACMRKGGCVSVSVQLQCMFLVPKTSFDIVTTYNSNQVRKRGRNVYVRSMNPSKEKEDMTKMR